MTGGESAPVFVPLERAGRLRWSRPTRLGFLDQLAVIPVADTEVLHLAHYAPVAIASGKTGPEVVLILHRDMCSVRLVDAEGRWLPPYVPLATRCLPFRNAAAGAVPEIAPGLCDEAGTPHPFLEADGTPAPEFAQIVGLLRLLARGQARLANAARLLVAADLLAPLLPLPDRPELVLASVSGDGLARLANQRAAVLTADFNQAFELAAAAIFSQRWLPPKSLLPPPRLMPLAAEANVTSLDIPRGGLEKPVLMDDSGLFSIDDFLNSRGADP